MLLHWTFLLLESTYHTECPNGTQTFFVMTFYLLLGEGSVVQASWNLKVLTIPPGTHTCCCVLVQRGRPESHRVAGVPALFLIHKSCLVAVMEWWVGGSSSCKLCHPQVGGGSMGPVACSPFLLGDSRMWVRGDTQKPKVGTNNGGKCREVVINTVSMVCPAAHWH